VVVCSIQWLLSFGNIVFYSFIIRLDPTPPAAVCRAECAVFATFFYSLPSESKRIWILFASYSHVSVYSQTPFIRIIRSYFLKNIRTNSLTNIRFDAKQIHGEANFLFRANIRLIFSHSHFHIQTNIRD
jgi:hypothetical protein